MSSAKEKVSAFWEAQRGINRVYEEYARLNCLSYTTLCIMGYIERFENCTQKMISELSFLPKQTVHSVINELKKQGYVELKEMEKDHRMKTIHFTERGRNYSNAILRDLHERECKAMESLSEEEQKQLVCTNQLYAEQFRKMIYR